MEDQSSFSGSGSRSTGPGRNEDEGDSKPPVNIRSALRLNTPQAEEGPGQAEAAAGVAALPQRSMDPKWSAPSPPGGSVIAEPPAPAARYAPPATASAEPTGYRGSSMPNPSSTRATHPAATSSSARRTTRPTSPSSPAARPGMNVAAGVPAVGAAGADTNEAPASEEEKGTSSGGIPKKYLYFGGVVLVALVVALVVVVLVLVVFNEDSPAPATGEGAPTSSPPTDASGTPTLATVAQRGSLNCGISLQPGFGAVSDGEYTGFDADLCRAVAAGLFGADATVEYTVVEPTTRFETLQNKEVDVLASVTTHTMERDVYEAGTGVGYSFSTPYYYAGLGFAGLPPYGACADELRNATDVCSDLKICVRDGTTHVDRVKELLPDAAIVLSPNLVAYYSTFSDGLCNVLAGEPADISEAVVRSAGYVGEYEVGTNAFSKEPLALVTRDGDAEFSDFVNWIVQALLAAEEQGITQSTATAFTQSTLFGEEYEDMFIDAVRLVGNYAEVYDRNLEPIVPRALANTINQGDTGLIYAFPFGAFSTEGPGPATGGSLETIVQRGHLRCGITRRAVFGVFDTGSQEWRGLDVDFCKAVSAAIFDGVTNTIVYTVLPATERFQALQGGSVDVLARITTLTIERDVLEPNAGAGFSFSQPNFYDGLSFGGIPPYGQCADNLDVTSADCEDLLICVNDGTTFLERLKELLPERYIAPQQTGELAIQGLATGACNAIAGGAQDVSTTSVAEVGEYDGPYENGVNRFSKDPLALVTRQDDPQFSAFVYWIVSSIFYAEEEGITQSTATRMPVLNLFGPLYSRMLRDVIESVGGYGEIYDRNAEDQIPRGGLNLLNVNPLGPQHYPFPGL